MPPAVANLQDLISQYTQATQPEQSNLDTQIANNESSGTTATAGIDAAKTAAFSNIADRANARGATFSGFTPNAEAGYTGSTYLPALAKLQTTIAATRNSLLGQKATLTTAANTNAVNERNAEQKSLDAWNQNQATIAKQEEMQRESLDAQAKQNELNRQNALSVAGARASSKGPTQAQIKQQDVAAMAQSLRQGNKQLGLGHAGGDGYVSPQNYAAAKSAWVGNGYGASEFDSAFSNFRNPKNPNYKVG